MIFFYILTFLSVTLSLSLLKASTVLITGANRGIGFEFAKQYKELGYTVIATTRDQKKSKELLSLNVQVESLDVSNSSSINALAEKLQDKPIDILINNAGIFIDRPATLESLKTEDMAMTFLINSAGPVFVTQALLPNLRQGKEKKIINISSQVGSIQNNQGGLYSYRASKAALNQLSKTMSLELESEGFTVITLHPGWVSTDMGGKEAPIIPVDSAKKMISVINSSSEADNGKYVDLENNKIPW